MLKFVATKPPRGKQAHTPQSHPWSGKRTHASGGQQPGYWRNQDQMWTDGVTGGRYMGQDLTNIGDTGDTGDMFDYDNIPKLSRTGHYNTGYDGVRSLPESSVTAESNHASVTYVTPNRMYEQVEPSAGFRGTGVSYGREGPGKADTYVTYVTQHQTPVTRFSPVTSVSHSESHHRHRDGHRGRGTHGASCTSHVTPRPGDSMTSQAPGRFPVDVPVGRGKGGLFGTTKHRPGDLRHVRWGPNVTGGTDVNSGTYVVTDITGKHAGSSVTGKTDGVTYVTHTPVPSTQVYDASKTDDYESLDENYEPRRRPIIIEDSYGKQGPFYPHLSHGRREPYKTGMDITDNRLYQAAGPHTSSPYLYKGPGVGSPPGIYQELKPVYVRGSHHNVKQVPKYSSVDPMHVTSASRSHVPSYPSQMASVTRTGMSLSRDMTPEPESPGAMKLNVIGSYLRHQTPERDNIPPANQFVTSRTERPIKTGLSVTGIGQSHFQPSPWHRDQPFYATPGYSPGVTQLPEPVVTSHGHRPTHGQSDVTHGQRVIPSVSHVGYSSYQPAHLTSHATPAPTSGVPRPHLEYADYRPPTHLDSQMLPGPNVHVGVSRGNVGGITYIPVHIHIPGGGGDPTSQRSSSTFGSFGTCMTDEVFEDAEPLSSVDSSFKDTCTYTPSDREDSPSWDNLDEDVLTNLVMTSCVPQLHHDLNNEAVNTKFDSRVHTVPGQGQRGGMTTLRDMITRTQDQMGDDVNLDMVYITERIIAMSFPSQEHEQTYRYHLKEVTRMLKTKHADNYLILNISDKREDLTRTNPQVLDYGWPDHLAPPLERLCSICKSIDSWMNSDPNHVVVIHCKGGRGRIAVIIAAYMHYSNICASADQALDRFAMKRFYDDKLGGLPQASQRRFVNYFAGLLSGAIKINSRPLFLHHILIHGVPNFDTKGGCRPFIKVYQAMEPVFTSGVYNVTDNMQKVCISISPGIPLRGDILIKCYHKKGRSGQREVVWRCQFHTCAISDYSLIFSKQELDDAASDPRFPEPGKVEFVFGPHSGGNVSVSGFKSDVTVPVDDNTDALVRWDSYEDFQMADGMENGIMGNMQTGSHVSSSVNAKDFTEKSYSSNVSTSKTNYGSLSPTPKHTVKPLDEQSQLDAILSDLLNDQVRVSTSKVSSRSPGTTESKTYTSYDSQTGPDGKVLHAEVTYKIPIKIREEKHSTVSTKTVSEERKSPHIPKNAFSYTAQTSEPIKSPDSMQGSRLHTLPYRTDYDNKYNTDSYSYRTMDSSHARGSDTEQSSSWLQEQQDKLRAKQDPRDDYRTMQEKLLVDELKSAQSKYMTKRSQSEADEKVMMDSYRTSPPPLLNGPVNVPINYTVTRTHTYAAEQVPSDSVFSSDSTYRTETRNFGSSSASKPPPSPGTQRAFSPTSPVPLPVRSSSKDYMARQSTKSTSSNAWQAQPKPLQRHHSDVSHDRDHIPERQNVPRLYSSITPPHSPRSLTPTQQSYQTSSYKTNYQTLQGKDQTDAGHLGIPRYSPTRMQVTEVRELTAPPGKEDRHYITEVFIHRTGSGGTGTTRKDAEIKEAGRLEELEKSLQAASNSVISTQQPQPVQTWQRSGNSGYETAEDTLTRRMLETRTYETRSQQQSSQVISPTEPPPRKIREIEEERVSLRPIGPGVQTLEPDGVGTGTLGRPTTPGFPTSPVQSAVSEQQHQMHSSHGPSERVITPTGTLSKEQLQFREQQQQFQTQSQPQQYQTQSQQYQTQSYQQYLTQQEQQQNQQFMGPAGHDAMLHVDTSNRIMPPTSMARSPSAGSPPSPGSLNTLRQQLHVAHNMSGSAISPGAHSLTGQSSPSVYYGLSRRGSISSLADSEAVHTTPRFVKDTSKFWYKPHITREDAIVLLKDKTPGSFVVRDSNSFPGAFGLAVKVATIPPNVQTKSTGDPAADLVRHFLIEPTPKGVRLRGCSNEPVFGSLAALVYQHSLTPLALPCKLLLPDIDQVDSSNPDSPHGFELPTSASALLTQGAACNVLFLNTVDTESLTGPQAVSRAAKVTFEMDPRPKSTVVHFKVSNQGITLTDNQRKLFFRRHYPVAAVTYCGMDPDDRKWKRESDTPGVLVEAKVFGFVARKTGGVSDNACHLFAELDPEQPASAIVNFVAKFMIGQSKVKS